MQQEHHLSAQGSSRPGAFGRPGPIRDLNHASSARDTITARPGGVSSAEDLCLDPGQNWWFHLDPAARYLISVDGVLLLANPAGQCALENGKLALTSGGALRFGSIDSDSRFEAAVLQVAGNQTSAFAILRQRHGGWLAADFYSVPGSDWILLALKEELAPTLRTLAAVSAAFQLTRSERDVLHSLLNGNCPKTAANLLHISEHTVRAHLRSIYAKMGVRGLVNTIRMTCGFM